MTEKAYWPWPSSYDVQSEIDFGPEELKYIRSLVAIWDHAETGAAGLADAVFEELQDTSDDQENLVRMFLNTAQLDTLSAQISNPYNTAKASTAAEHLDPVPDQKVADLFRSGNPIDYEATADDVALWKAAWKTGFGINPKRPFGTGMVSRDIRQIVDPEKTLSAKKFATYKKTLESRLMLSLQSFVQNAELRFGTYIDNGGVTWDHIDTIEDDHGEWIDRCQWISNVAAAHHYQAKDFTKTVEATAHLLCEKRLEGAYSDVVKSLRLDDFFGVNEASWSKVPTQDIEVV